MEVKRLSKKQKQIIQDLRENSEWFIQVFQDDRELKHDISMSDIDSNEYYSVDGRTLQKLIDSKIVSKFFDLSPSIDITVQRYKLK